jgi:thiopeptide-type bacteriocin biosynthesis protein
MPAVGRFLVELPRGMDARLTPFDWGAASGLPFRPALRYGRTLLTAARWRIDPAGLPATYASDGEWGAGWQLLRAKLRLPAWVHVGSGDQRLRLNLDRAMDLALLRAHADASDGPFTLMEAADPKDFGWFSGRAHEIVVPLASTATPAAAPAPVTEQRSWPPPAPTAPIMPGTDGLISASLTVEPSLMDDVLGAIPALIEGWDERPMLWFIRMRRPVPHLRLRWHTDDIGYAVVSIGRWAVSLRRQGLAGDLTIDTYYPEVGRYGDGPALAAAHRLFAADSTAALGQLAAQQEHRLDRLAVTASSMVDLASAMLGSRAQGCEWLIRRPEPARCSPVDRGVLRQATTLDPAALPGPVTAAWRERAQAAARYADVLKVSGGSITPDSVLASLLHLHHVRTVGPDENAERVTYRLARHIALATARRRLPRVGVPA